MIDIHSHILPGIDDGSRDINTSLEMLKIARDDGTNTIIATPHYYKGRFENSYKDILIYVESLKKEVSKNNIDIEILPGQEVFVDKDTIKSYKEGIIGTLNNTRYMLIEFPMGKLPGYALDVIYELRLLGVIPIIAHPERYGDIIEKPLNINKFIDEGCFFQVNSGSLSGIFGDRVKKTAEIIVKNGLANFLASDTHSTGKRCPKVKESLDIITGIDDNYGNSIMENVNKMLNNEVIIQNGVKIREKKSIFDIFRMGR